MARKQSAKQDNNKKSPAVAAAPRTPKKVYDKVPNRAGCGKKRQPISGFGVDKSRNEVGSFQTILKREYEERELRKELAANASQHPGIQAIRDNVDEIKELLPKLNSRRKVESERRLKQLNYQLVEIDAALVDFGFKSKITKANRTEAILAIRMSNGYLRRIVHDALFGANRAYYAERAPLTDAMAD